MMQPDWLDFNSYLIRSKLTNQSQYRLKKGDVYLSNVNLTLVALLFNQNLVSFSFFRDFASAQILIPNPGSDLML